MKDYKRPEAKPREYKSIRAYAKTHAKLMLIAKYFNAPLTEVLDHIANEILKNNIHNR